jgi:FRG domain
MDSASQPHRWTGEDVAQADHWCEHTLRSWRDFEVAVESLTTLQFNFSPFYCWRGQAERRESLRSTLARIGDYPPFDLEATETLLFDEFSARRHVVDHPEWSTGAPTRAEAVFQMQHYGAPTRLLDWSLSPFVAAYFACRDATPTFEGRMPALKSRVSGDHTHEGADGEVWAAPAVYLNGGPGDLLMSSGLGKDARSILERDTGAAPIAFTGPPIHSVRSSAQQSAWSVATEIHANHAELILAAMRTFEARKKLRLWYPAWRMRIPAQLKLGFLRNLRQRGIHAGSLLPGPDGLGRSLRELAQIVQFEAALKDRAAASP